MKSSVHLISSVVAVSTMTLQLSTAAVVKPATVITTYPDGRPAARYRLEARDHGPVLHHGDSRNCGWSRHIIGLPSVIKVGGRLAIFYDGNTAETIPAGVKSHMNRDVGLAWLDLPLAAPESRQDMAK